MTHEANIILERVVLVKVEANIYGARKKLKKEDLVLADGSKLPPEDLASLGSKRLLDPDQLTVFNRLKKEAERICLRVGTRFLGGFAIPNESAADITAELERIARDFAVAKTNFLAGYDAAVTDWVVRHPEFAGIIEQAVDSVEFVSTRLSFDYLLVTVGMPEALPLEDVTRLETKIGSMSEQMFYEIAVEANQFIEQSLLGKDQVTRSALRPIRRMREKLDGLSFLDYRVAPVVNTIDDLLVKIPVKGAITGGILQEILATALLLADPVKTRRHGEGLLVAQNLPKADSAEDEIAELTVDEPVSVLAIPTPVPETFVPVDKIPNVIDADAEQIPTGFSNLFDGIFDGDIESEDEAGNEAIDTLIAQRQSTAAILTRPNDEAGLEVVTSEESTAQDYWF
ncbi:DUF3150 domain-containing protein [Methylobacter sp. S3L5C]|uniref:DUF3150 domain-containing protein n=1 Tax=Methylobacter sp. S3L5C TaxID=2839024 RepID=UPI001FAD12F1|nr:DUF3150 domain-containing protein [Methylobacter sp. S3L5C]